MKAKNKFAIGEYLVNVYGEHNKKIILFPGWLAPNEAHPNFLEMLAESFTIYSIVPPGYEGNPDAKYYSDFSHFSKQFREFVESHQLDTAVLMGFSMGGRIILDYLSQYQHRGPVVLVGTPGDTHPIPVWGIPIIKFTPLLHLASLVSLVKLTLVNIAIASFKDPKFPYFKSDHTSLTGAFNTLLATLRAKGSIRDEMNRACFIYGEFDQYLSQFKNQKPKHLFVIKGAHHTCFVDHEREIVDIIVRFK